MQHRRPEAIVLRCDSVPVVLPHRNATVPVPVSQRPFPEPGFDSNSAKVNRGLARAVALVRLTTPGQVDATLASLGSFFIQLLALRIFDPDELGAYALVFSGVVFAALVPTNMVFAVYQLKAVELSETIRLSLAKASSRSGLVVAFVSGIFVALSVLPASGQVSPGFALGLVATAWPAMVASSLQDHLRRSSHIANKSWLAARMSAIYLLVAAFGLWFLSEGGGDSRAPFGVMAAANFLSVIYFFLGSSSGGHGSESIPRVELARVGKWLLTGGALVPLGTYASLAIIEELSGLGDVGFIEAARIVGRPVQVIGLGLLAVVVPRITTAAVHSDFPTARRWGAFYLVVLGSAVALAAAGVATPIIRDWLERLVPVAFERPTLVFLTLCSSALAIADVPLRVQMLGHQRPYVIAYGSLIGAGVGVAVAISAIYVGANAGPLSAGMAGVASWVAMSTVRRRIEANFQNLERSSDSA